MKITIEISEPTTAGSQYLIKKLSDTLAEITGDSGNTHFNCEDMYQEGALWIIAKDEKGALQGCGAFRPLKPGIAELKRMFAAPEVQVLDKP